MAENRWNRYTETISALCILQSVLKSTESKFPRSPQTNNFSVSYQQYSRSVTWRLSLLAVTTMLLPVMLCVSISVGAASVPLWDTVVIFCGGEVEPRLAKIVLEIRLPQALAAVLAGAGLAISGATMQGVLRNPLSSPMTLGISNAAAFGAALALFIGGASISAMDKSIIGGFSQGMIALCAFGCATITAVLILMLGRLHGSRSEVIILVGVALNSLFAAGITLLQYLADDSRLAAIVYWAFGDTARANWNAIMLMIACLLPISVWFLSQSWNYNAIVLGEETALGLGVPVRRVRLVTMLLSSFLTAVLVSLLGIIGFVGLVVPHVARLCVGVDNRFLLPFSLVFGGLLLLGADTFARVVFAPHLLPVSILTAFIGVPIFLGMLLGKRSV